MKSFLILIFIIVCNFNLVATTNETNEIYDILSSLEYKNTYPISLKEVDYATGDSICIYYSDGSSFLSTPRNQRFWICDLKTGKYWKKDNNVFDLNFGLYSASNRSITHSKTYIIIIEKGFLRVYDWYDSEAISLINNILTELKYSPLNKLKILENVFKAHVSSHVFGHPLMQKMIQ